MAKSKNKHGRIHPTYENVSILREGDLGETGDLEQDGHVIVVTQFGLAMLVAGLRSIAHESPEVNPLLETLEDALRQGMEERKNA